MKKKKEQITVEGEVLDKDNRKVTSYGSGTKFISIPKKPAWKQFLTATILTISLVRDDDGEACIIIERPKEGKQAEKVV